MMIMASRSERKGLLWPLSNPFDAIAALLIIANVVGNLLRNASFAGAALIGIISLVFAVRGGTTTWFRGLLEVTVGVILFGYLVQIAGEVFGGWVTNTVTLSLLLALVVTVSVSRSRPNLATNRLLTVFGAIASLGCLAWLLLLRLSTSTVVNFLGYGYDNAAHLAQTKLIIGNGGTTLLSGGLDTSPSFIQNMAQAGSSTVASLVNLMGDSDADSYQVSVVFAFVTISIPILAVVAPLITLRFHRQNWFLNLALVLVVITTFLSGYLSRVWFSGYFASNLGTLLLVMTAVAVSTPTPIGLTTPILSVLLAAHIYPLFLVLGAAVLAPRLFISGRELLCRRSQVRSKLSIRNTLLIAGVLLLLVLPTRATSRSYGGSQFLTDGGIEYLPVVFMTAWGTLFVLLPALLLTYLIKDVWWIFAVTLLSTLAIGVGAYSLLEVDRITYYPTKIIVTIVLASIAMVVVKAESLSKRLDIRVASTLAFMAAISGLAFQPDSRIFTSAYMGEAPTVVGAAIRSEPEVVQAKEILELAEVSIQLDRPILYLSKIAESELNSRWLNTLSGQWNDPSWSTWLSLRDSIRLISWNEYSRILSETSLVLATDDYEMYDEVSRLNPGQICLLSISDGCIFR
jgi:hypothetical protein